MFGRLIPEHLINSWIDLFETPQTIVFIHRWFGWLLLILTPFLYYAIKKQNYPADIQHGRSEEHTSELQSLTNLVCRLLLEKKKITLLLTIPTRGRVPPKC